MGNAVSASVMWLLCVGCLSVHAGTGAAQEALATQIAIQGDRFTINSEPTFLVGISYYGGLGASLDTIRSDLEDLVSMRINWIRVWATWDSFGENVSAFDERGDLREPYASRLKTLVAECDRRGLIVDVTLARSRRENDAAESVHLPDLAAHKLAVRNAISLLSPYDNWYLDLANERDVGDARYVEPVELRELRAIARQAKPSLLVTASFGGHDLSLSDTKDALEVADCDFLAVHRPRHARSPGQTESETRALREMLRGQDRMVPIHHQEPFRRGYANWEPTADDFLLDLKGAIRGGAAGWCFHNGATKTSQDGQPRRSFDLRRQRLLEQLDEDELQVLRGIRHVMEAGR